jgi:hypothetical protein
MPTQPSAPRDRAAVLALALLVAVPAACRAGHDAGSTARVVASCPASDPDPAAPAPTPGAAGGRTPAAATGGAVAIPAAALPVSPAGGTLPSGSGAGAAAATAGAPGRRHGAAPGAAGIDASDHAAVTAHPPAATAPVAGRTEAAASGGPPQRPDVALTSGFIMVAPAAGGLDAGGMAAPGSSSVRDTGAVSSADAPAGGGGESAGGGGEAERAARLRLELRAEPAQAEVGRVLSVEILADGRVALIDAPFHLLYDATRLRFLDAAAGELLARGGGGVIFLANGRTRPGDVTVGIGRADRRRGVRGAGVLARVRFLATGEGTAPLRIGAALAWADDGSRPRVEGGSLDLLLRPPR